MRKKEYVWEVVRLRARGEYLGKVKAPDEEAALKAAVKAFALTDPEHKKRLLVRRYAKALSWNQHLLSNRDDVAAFTYQVPTRCA